MSKKETVLIVDDEMEFLKMIATVLEKEGYEIKTATSGMEALQVLTMEKIDLIVLDVKMPDMDGYEVCRRIREDLLLSHIPVIMLTCMTDIDDRVKGIKTGGDDYITKPFESEELFVRIRNLLERYSRELGANPLTYLPGTGEINKEMQRRIDDGEEFTVFYIDLTNFKAFNERYGFDRGDEIIKLVVNILISELDVKRNTNNFIGHIGGDDFIVITGLNKIESICDKIIMRFDYEVLSIYDKIAGDRLKKTVTEKDVNDKENQFPLMSIMINVVTNEKQKFDHFGQITSLCSRMKEKRGKQGESTFFMCQEDD
ncbi:MAG: response regulator [Elusimicrobiota bacterium]